MTGPAEQELHEEEEALALPSFEILVRNGEPVVSGSYFLHPPLRAVRAEWDADEPTRLNVWADDGSEWYAPDVPRSGHANVVLHPVGDHPALKQARAVTHLAAETGS